MASCALFNFVVWGAVGGVICVLGLLGNLLSVVAFQRDRRSPTTTLLQCLASSDFVLLLGVLVTEAWPYTCSYTGLCHNVWTSWPYIRYVWLLLVPASHMCSIWFVVLVAGNRYWAVCRPHTMSRVWHNTRTAVYVVVVLVVVVVFNVPRYFEYTMVVNGTQGWVSEEQTSLGASHSYRVVYKVMLVNLLLVVLPLLTLVLLTARILLSLRRIQRNMNQQRRRRRQGGAVGEERSKPGGVRRGATSEVTVVLVTVVVVAIVCQSPLAVFHFVRYSLRYSCGEFVFYLDNISKLLVNINSCVNFTIYCLFSRKFRALLCSALNCRRTSGAQSGPSEPKSTRAGYTMAPVTNNK